MFFFVENNIFLFLTKKWPEGTFQQGGTGVTKVGTEKKLLDPYKPIYPTYFYMKQASVLPPTYSSVPFCS